jgi:hypothetical protein
MSDQHARDGANGLDQWCVTRCGCGHITLHLGDVQQVFTAAEFEQLYRLLVLARQQFRGQANAPVAH